jgi:hypothetical protein
VGWLGAFETQGLEIEFAHESIDCSDGVVVPDPVVEPLREKHRLRSALTFDESLHRSPHG